MWFWLALFFALWTPIGTSISKRVLRNTDVLVFVAFGNLLVTLWMTIFILIRGLPNLDLVFWQMVLASALINIFATLFAFKAIKIAPISLLAPLSAFTPIVAAFFGLVVLGERIDSLKFLGIILIVFGAYLLNAADIKGGILVPFARLFQNRGVQLTLLANLLWGITPVFEKTAIFHTRPQDPLMTTFSEGVLLTSFLLFIMFAKAKKPLVQFKRNILWYVIPAPLSALASWAAFTAYSLFNLGAVTAIFKLSVLFTILFGALFFKEERIKERFLGASVMIAGTILLVAT